ncbi:MAG: hypothetical protein IJA69_02690 [Clostridia bacterium]|nr:hypothetical protein [Clostridia bacterium]
MSFLKQERNLNGYNYIVNLFANIYNQCSNPQQLIKAFVECDMNLFLEHITKEFHYESHDKILALVYKMDAFLRCHESDSPFAQSDQISIIESMFYDYIDMAKHKAEVENKQITNITDIWNSYRYPDDKSGEFIFEGVKQYFKNATSATNYELNMEETMLACSALVSIASKEKDLSEFKKYITPTLCKHMFSKNMLIFTDNLTPSTTMKQAAFRYMFSQRCELFQKEPQLRLNILSELLDHSSIIEFDFAKFVSAEDFCEVLKQKPYHAAKLYSLNEKKFSEVIEMLDDTTKSQRNFVGNIKNLCELYQQTNKDYRPLMLTYLCSFKDAEIQNRVKDTYFKSLMPSTPTTEQDGPIC